MIKKDFNSLLHGTKSERHFIFVKYGFICFLIAMLGFGLLYFFDLKKLGFLITAMGIIVGNVIIFSGVVNFFTKDKPVEEKYVKVKQPWE